MASAPAKKMLSYILLKPQFIEALVKPLCMKEDLTTIYKREVRIIESEEINAKT